MARQHRSAKWQFVCQNTGGRDVTDASHFREVHIPHLSGMTSTVEEAIFIQTHRKRRKKPVDRMTASPSGSFEVGQPGSRSPERLPTTALLDPVMTSDAAAPSPTAASQAGATTAPASAAPSGAVYSACSIATALLVALTQGLGLQLVSSNLAAIQGSLGATAAEASWLTTAYLASTLSSTLLLAKFRFHFGIRSFASIGLTVFLVVSALHLTTDSVASAVAVRAALGFAAAPLSTLTILYMLGALPPRLAPIALVVGFGALQLGQPLSRVIPIHLLDYGQWHGLFLIDVALALLSFAAIHAVPIAQIPRSPSFSRGDLIAFPLYATGLALLSVVLTQGRTYWWTDAPWIGVCLAGAIACIGLYTAFDLSRTNPLLDLRWLMRPYMLRFIVAVLLFRIVLSEQNVGVVGLMSTLGQTNEQMQTLFSFAALGMIAGILASVMLAMRGGTPLLTLLSVLLIAAAAWHDSSSTSLTRPTELYASQVLMSAGLTVFFASACLLGFGPVIADGSRNLITFLAAFNMAQYVGYMLGLASIQTFVDHREKWHYAQLAQHLSLTDPQVVWRLAQYSGSIGQVVTDPVQGRLQGVSALARQLTREAYVLAYDDVFAWIAALCAAMFVWLAFLARRGLLRQRAAAAITAAAAHQTPSLATAP